MKNKILTAVLLFLSAGIVSCSKFLDPDWAIDSLTNEEAFSDSANVASSINGVYYNVALMGWWISSGGMTLYTGLYSDELRTTSSNASVQEFANSSLTPNNSTNYSYFWNASYGNVLYKVNACIEGLSNNENISSTYRNRLLGEMYWFRAMYYFYLTNLYGDVPLVLNTNYKENLIKGRSPEDSVFMQIEEDLRSSKQFLRPFKNQLLGGRPGFYAASALLGKVSLFEKKYDIAKNESDTVINSGLFTLEKKLGDVFSKTSKESIFSLKQLYNGSTDYYTTDGFYFIPSNTSTIPTYYLTDSLLNAFSAEDQRRQQWIGTNMINGISYSYPFKYKAGANATSAQEENYIFLRLGEQYLIRSEANLSLNKLTESVSDINIIRKRAGLSDTLLSSYQDIMTEIKKQRRLELFCEWGNRWLDLKRWNEALQTLQNLKLGFERFRLLWPIPLTDIGKSFYLTQNEGY